MNQLVVDPKRYVLNYLGVKNSDDLEVALEIYLADKVFNPKFLNGVTYDIDGKFERVLELYEQVNTEGLSGIYYFNFLDFSIESGLIKKEHFDELSVYTAETILRNSKLKSTIASNTLKTNDFYREVHREKLELIEDEDVAKKVMGLITLHNKELYKLNSLKMVELDEYKIFESFKDEFIQAEDSILANNYVC